MGRWKSEAGNSSKYNSVTSFKLAIASSMAGALADGPHFRALGHVEIIFFVENGRQGSHCHFDPSCLFVPDMPSTFNSSDSREYAESANVLGRKCSSNLILPIATPS